MTTTAKKVGLPEGLSEKIVSTILQYVSPERIILFGSRARGDNLDVSDIDIAVDCVESIGFLEEILNEEVETLLKIQLINLNKVPDRLKEEILKEGKILYEKTSTIKK